MTLIRRTSPFGELLSLRQAMDRLFDERFFRPLAGTNGGATEAMPLDIYATPDTLVLEAALPGVKPEDVDISILGDTLTLTATSASEHKVDEGGYHIQEVRRGRFSRTVSLPTGLRTDAAAATFENGILRLAIPKAEQALPRQIRVNATTEGQATPVAATSASGGADAPVSAGAQVSDRPDDAA